MTNGANYKRGKLHHSPWHSDIRTSNQLNKLKFGRLYLQYGYCQFRYNLKLIVNRASMLFGNVSMVIGTGYPCCYEKPTYGQPLSAKEQATRSVPHFENERQGSLKDFGLINKVIVKCFAHCYP